jgi:hypothetical protein
MTPQSLVDKKGKKTEHSIFKQSGRIESWSLGYDSPFFAYAIPCLLKMREVSLPSF